MPALAIRQDRSAAALRRLSPREPGRRGARRVVAGASGAAGLARAGGARLAGMERQALRDAVIRYNAEGPQGLHDRPRPGRPEALTPGRQAALKAWVLRGPDPERDGVSAWRVADIRDHAAEAHGGAHAGGTPGRRAGLEAWGRRGPDPERDGVSAWRVADIRDHAEEAYGVRYSEWGMARLPRPRRLPRPKPRPRPPPR